MNMTNLIKAEISISGLNRDKTISKTFGSMRELRSFIRKLQNFLEEDVEVSINAEISYFQESLDMSFGRIYSSLKTNDINQNEPILLTRDEIEEFDIEILENVANFSQTGWLQEMINRYNLYKHPIFFEGYIYNAPEELYQKYNELVEYDGDLEFLELSKSKGEESYLKEDIIHLILNLSNEKETDVDDYDSVDEFYTYIGYELESEKLLQRIGINSTSKLQEVLKEAL